MYTITTNAPGLIPFSVCRDCTTRGRYWGAYGLEQTPILVHISHLVTVYILQTNVFDVISTLLSLLTKTDKIVSINYQANYI